MAGARGYEVGQEAKEGGGVPDPPVQPASPTHGNTEEGLLRPCRGGARPPGLQDRRQWAGERAPDAPLQELCVRAAAAGLGGWLCG